MVNSDVVVLFLFAYAEAGGFPGLRSGSGVHVRPAVIVDLAPAAGTLEALFGLSTGCAERFSPKLLIDLAEFGTESEKH